MTKLKVIDEEYGFANYDGIPVVSSLKVANAFNKRHDNVLADIRNLIEKVERSEERAGEISRLRFQESNFIETTYISSRNKEYSAYLLTKDGFTLLVMGYTDNKAIDMKLAYIRKYNEMENYIKNLDNCRKNYPALTSTLKMVKGNPKYYDYSNEANLINYRVLGMSAKKFKEMNGIDKNVNSIRPFLNAENLFMIGHLQMVDIGLLVAFPHNYKKRKEILEDHAMNLRMKLRNGQIPLLED